MRANLSGINFDLALRKVWTYKAPGTYATGFCFQRKVHMPEVVFM